MGRARGACIGCRSNKQKCDSAVQVPCRRCQVYNIECTFNEGDGPPASASRVATSSSRVTGPSEGMEARLSRIEDTLGSLVKLLSDGGAAAATVASPSAATSHTATSTMEVPPHHPPASLSPGAMELTTDSNPLQILVSTMEEMDALTGTRQSRASTKRKAEDFDGPQFDPPDVIDRTLLTTDGCASIFKVYWERIHAWIPIIPPQDALALRRKSPFLFHAILLVTAYYNRAVSPQTEKVYFGLTSIVNELLATTVVLAPEPSTITKDTIRALVLIAYFKPVQTASFVGRGESDPAQMAQRSKINPLSSITLQSLLASLSRLLRIDAVPANFLATLTPSPPSSTPPDTLLDLRLWVFLVSGDVHSSLQGGRDCWTELGPTRQITRQFATLSPEISDSRQAALLELYTVVHHCSKSSDPSHLPPIQRRLQLLPQINSRLAEWLSFWSPKLSHAQKNGDPLAYTTIQAFWTFVKLATNGAVFTRWAGQCKAHDANRELPTPTLIDEEWEYVSHAVSAAQRSIFALSVEASKSENGLREGVWPRQPNGVYEELELDHQVVEDHKMAVDTVLCIVYIYSLLFLVRVGAAGFICSDLIVSRSTLDCPPDPNRPNTFSRGGKLHRLLQLGSSFLEAVAPNTHHPASKHSILIDQILHLFGAATQQDLELPAVNNPAASFLTPMGNEESQDIFALLSEAPPLPDFLYLTQPYSAPNELLSSFNNLEGFDWTGENGGTGTGGSGINHWL